MNIVIIKGNLVRDPELRYTPTGKAVSKGSVAHNKTWVGEDGQKHEQVSFIDFEVWGRTAEFFSQYFAKGKPILIQGELKQDSWDDKQTGQKKSKIIVAARSIEFCGGERTQPGDRQTRNAEAPQQDASYDDGYQQGGGDDTPF